MQDRAEPAGSSEEDPGEDDQTRLSKLLAFLLRHRPDHVGIELDPEGWVELDVLVEAIETKGNLHFPVDRSAIEAVTAGQSRSFFEQRDDRIRARSGHSVPGVAVVSDTPEFLFCGLSADALARRRDEETLATHELVLVDDEGRLEEAELIVIEAARASRNGVEFERCEGGYTAASVPIRFVLNERPAYTRQISAGGVLVRIGEEVEFALIRTLPRSQASGRLKAASARLKAQSENPEPQPQPDPEPTPEIAEIAEIEEGRKSNDRRADNDRRRQEESRPPDGVERRRGRSRRVRRRRRTGRWSAQGRLELPKGKLEPGETAEQAAVRELKEEMGVEANVRVVEILSKNHYSFRTPDGKCIFKTVHYFMLRADVREPSFTPRLEEGIVSVEWWTARRAIEQVAFPNLKPVLEKAWSLARD